MVNITQKIEEKFAEGVGDQLDLVAIPDGAGAVGGAEIDSKNGHELLR